MEMLGNVSIHYPAYIAIWKKLDFPVYENCENEVGEDCSERLTYFCVVLVFPKRSAKLLEPGLGI